MNKKLIISLGIVALISASAAYADTTIYTDSLGRMHFLGRDAANNTATSSKYSNSAEQDLTRKLYEQAESGVINDTSYDQHPLKNYDNTFPDTRFNPGYWRTKRNYNENTVIDADGTKKTVVTATKGITDTSGQYAYGSTFLNEPSEKNVVKTTTKKHWWNKNKK